MLASVDTCPCGYSFSFLDRVRQPEHVGYRYVGRSGRVYCSVYCGEQARDAWESVMVGWYPLGLEPA